MEVLTVKKSLPLLYFFPFSGLVPFVFLLLPYITPTMQSVSIDSSRYDDVRSFNSSHFQSFASQQENELADFISLQDLFLSNKAIELLLDYVEYGVIPQDSGMFTLF